MFLDRNIPLVRVLSLARLAELVPGCGFTSVALTYQLMLTNIGEPRQQSLDTHFLLVYANF